MSFLETFSEFYKVSSQKGRLVLQMLSFVVRLYIFSIIVIFLFLSYRYPFFSLTMKNGFFSMLAPLCQYFGLKILPVPAYYKSGQALGLLRAIFLEANVLATIGAFFAFACCFLHVFFSLLKRSTKEVPNYYRFLTIR